MTVYNTSPSPFQLGSMLACIVQRDELLLKDPLLKQLLSQNTHTTHNPQNHPKPEAGAAPAVNADGWLLEPEDFSALPPVRPLTPDASPPALWDVANDICRNSGAPLDFLISGLMVLFGAVMAQFAMIKPKIYENLSFFTNIFGMIIANVSSRKSSAIDALNNLLAPLCEKEKMRYAKEKEVWRIELESAKQTNELARKGIEKKYAGDIAKATEANDYQRLNALRSQLNNDVARGTVPEPPEPKERRVQVDKINVSSMMSALVENPAVLMLTDEIAELIQKLMQPGSEDFKGILLTSTNGGKSGDTTHTHGDRSIENTRVSLFGTIQPQRLDIVRKFDASSGFSERLQELVWPDVKPVFAWRDEPCQTDPSTLQRIVERADNCAQVARQREKERARIQRDISKCRDNDELEQLKNELEKFTKEKIYCCIGLSDEAREIFVGWHEDFARKWYEKDAGAGSALYKHADKMYFFVLKLSAIYEFIQNPDKFNDYLEGVDNRVLISEEAVRFAITRCKYLMSHAARFHRATSFASVLLDKMRSGRVKNHFTVSELDKLFEVKKLDVDAREAKRRQIRSAVDELEKRGWIRKCKTEQNPLGGRPTVRYELHPSLLNHDRS